MAGESVLPNPLRCLSAVVCSEAISDPPDDERHMTTTRAVATLVAVSAVASRPNRWKFDETSKWCNSCERQLPLDAFALSAARPSGRQSYCRGCQTEATRRYRAAHPERAREKNRRTRERFGRDYYRDRNLRLNHGITLVEYEALLEAQDGLCAICDGAPNGSGALHVDHDHESGRIRGLLCSNCNRGIGHLQDDPVILERAIGYLRR
jgi:hypothetical protein